MSGGSVRNQYLGVLRHVLVVVGFGANTGWTSVNIPALQGPNSPLPSGRISQEEASWIVSILGIGSIVGILINGWAIEALGRKIPGTCLGIPQIVGWLLISFAQNPYYLYVARFFGGLGGGALFVVIPIYVTEIAEIRYEHEIHEPSIAFLFYFIGFVGFWAQR